MLPEEVVLGLDVQQGVLVLFVKRFVLLESCVYFVVFFVDLQSVLHDEFLSLRGGLEVKDFHLTSQFFKFPAGCDQVLS